MSCVQAIFFPALPNGHLMLWQEDPDTDQQVTNDPSVSAAEVQICRYLRSRPGQCRACWTPSAVGARRRRALAGAPTESSVSVVRAVAHRTELPNCSTESRETPWRKPLRTAFIRSVRLSSRLLADRRVADARAVDLQESAARVCAVGCSGRTVATRRTSRPPVRLFSLLAQVREHVRRL
jgi:hypothetical protein